MVEPCSVGLNVKVPPKVAVTFHILFNSGAVLPEIETISFTDTGPSVEKVYVATAVMPVTTICDILMETTISVGGSQFKTTCPPLSNGLYSDAVILISRCAELVSLSSSSVMVTTTHLSKLIDAPFKSQFGSSLFFKRNRNFSGPSNRRSPYT